MTERSDYDVYVVVRDASTLDEYASAFQPVTTIP